jgi:hypothetical protein
MMKRLVFAILVAAPALASAQDRIEYKKRTVLDLTGATIEGELVKPEGSYIVNRKLSKFTQLIQTRQSYLDEIRISHNDL